MDDTEAYCVFKTFCFRNAVTLQLKYVPI
jgi:hypothetical protein